jgi:hypothetical protein
VSSDGLRKTLYQESFVRSATVVLVKELGIPVLAVMAAAEPETRIENRRETRPEDRTDGRIGSEHVRQSSQRSKENGICSMVRLHNFSTIPADVVLPAVRSHSFANGSGQGILLRCHALYVGSRHRKQNTTSRHQMRATHQPQVSVLSAI